jgi:hypothetical protein
MPRKPGIALLLAAILAVAAADAWSQSPANAKSLDPLVADPQHYSLDFENQWVQVTRERMGPHEKMPMHQHLPPGALIVFVTARNNRLTTPDGKSTVTTNHPGEIQWAGPATHRSENLNDAVFEAIRIQPKEPAPGAAPKPAPPEKMDAVVVDPQHYHVEFENQYVRVIRVNLGPHEKLIMHKHPDTAAVVVHLTDQDMRQGHLDGKTVESHYKAGKARWAPPDVAHQDENLGDKPVEIVRVELKQAR